jgi:hypothetical protein
MGDRGVWGRAVARLGTGDSAFLKRREELMKHPKSITAAFTRPFRDIENGLYGGIIGLVKVPYNSAKRDGAYGLVTGIPMGIVGLAAKPIVGVLDAVSHTTESMGDAVKVLTKETQVPLRRRRLSNIFGVDGRVMAYSRTNALGTYILEVVESSRWTISLLDGHIIANTSWLSRSLFRSKGKGGVTDQQMSDLTRIVMSTRMTSSSTTSLRMRNQGALQEAFSELHAEALARALRENGSHAPDGQHELEGVSHSYFEFVVYTAVLERAPGNDMVIIISTVRVVVASYKRFSSDSHIKILWQCRITNSRPPTLDSGSASSVLTLRARTEERQLRQGRSQNGKSANEYELRVDYNDYELINIYNVIHAMLGEFSYFHPNHTVAEDQRNTDVVFDSETGVLKVGAWEYARELDAYEEGEGSSALSTQGLRLVLDK